MLILGNENYKIDSLMFHKLNPKWIKKIAVLKSEEEKCFFGDNNGVILIYPKKRIYPKNTRPDTIRTKTEATQVL